jgi:hypothetical protein
MPRMTAQNIDQTGQLGHAVDKNTFVQHVIPTLQCQTVVPVQSIAPTC